VIYQRVHGLAVQINNPSMHGVQGRSGAVGLAITFVGVLLVTYGATPLVRHLVWRSHAISARALVIENVPQSSGRSRTSWLPIVEFRIGQRTVMSLVRSASKREEWPLGQKIDVLYDPADPHRVAPADAPMPVPGTLIAGLAIIGIYLAAVA